MSASQYESMKDAFEEEEAFERIGIYHNAEKYAIVVRLPNDNKLRLVGMGAGIGATGLALGLATGSGVTIRQKSKWIQAVDSLMKDGARFAHLCSHILSIRQPSADDKDFLDSYLKMCNKIQANLLSLEIELPKVQNNEDKNHESAKDIIGRVNDMGKPVSSFLKYVATVREGEVEPIAKELGEQVIKEIEDVKSYSTWIH